MSQSQIRGLYFHNDYDRQQQGSGQENEYDASMMLDEALSMTFDGISSIAIDDADDHMLDGTTNSSSGDIFTVTVGPGTQLGIHVVENGFVKWVSPKSIFKDSIWEDDQVLEVNGLHLEDQTTEEIREIMTYLISTNQPRIFTIKKTSLQRPKYNRRKEHEPRRRRQRPRSNYTSDMMATSSSSPYPGSSRSSSKSSTPSLSSILSPNNHLNDGHERRKERRENNRSYITKNNMIDQEERILSISNSSDNSLSQHNNKVLKSSSKVVRLNMAGTIEYHIDNGNNDDDGSYHHRNRNQYHHHLHEDEIIQISDEEEGRIVGVDNTLCSKNTDETKQSSPSNSSRVSNNSKIRVHSSPSTASSTKMIKRKGQQQQHQNEGCCSTCCSCDSLCWTTIFVAIIVIAIVVASFSVGFLISSDSNNHRLTQSSSDTFNNNGNGYSPTYLHEMRNGTTRARKTNRWY